MYCVCVCVVTVCGVVHSGTCSNCMLQLRLLAYNFCFLSRPHISLDKLSYNKITPASSGVKLLVLVSICVYVMSCIHTCFVDKKKKFESSFSDRLTFSNIRGRTFRQIYRLALALLSPFLVE